MKFFKGLKNQSQLSKSKIDQEDKIVNLDDCPEDNFINYNEYDDESFVDGDQQVESLINYDDRFSITNNWWYMVDFYMREYPLFTKVDYNGQVGFLLPSQIGYEKQGNNNVKIIATILLENNAHYEHITYINGYKCSFPEVNEYDLQTAAMIAKKRFRDYNIDIKEIKVMEYVDNNSKTFGGCFIQLMGLIICISSINSNPNLAITSLVALVIIGGLVIMPSTSEDSVASLTKFHIDDSSIILNYQNKFECFVSNDSIIVNNFISFDEHIIIPSIMDGVKVKIIGANSFKNSNIKEIDIHDGIEEIRNYAFSGCKNLERIIVPSSLLSIHEFVFYDCKKLHEISLPYNLVSISNNTFSNSGLKEVSLPLKISEIPTECFSNCYNLAQVKLSDLTTKICSRAFMNCNSLEKICIPNNVKVIEQKAFKGCKSLKVINLPEGLVSIESELFYDCINLKKIYVPNSIKRIDKRAFLKMVYYQPDRRYNMKHMELPISDITILCHEGSYAMHFARENNIKYEKAQ